MMARNRSNKFSNRWSGSKATPPKTPRNRAERRAEERRQAKEAYKKRQKQRKHLEQFEKSLKKMKMRSPSLRTSVNRIAKSVKKAKKDYKKYLQKLEKDKAKADKEAQKQSESLARVVAGKPKQLRDVFNVDTPDLVKMSREELLKYYKIANRNVKNRLKAFEERELDSFAIESLIRRGGISDDFESMSRDEILKDLLLAKKFLSYRTSTVSGYMSYLNEVNKRLAAGDSSIRALIADLEEDEKSTLWDIYYEVLSANAGQLAQMISDGLISSDQVQAMVARQFVSTKSIDADSYVQNFFTVYKQGGDFNKQLRKTDFTLDNDEWSMTFNK